MLVIGVDEAGRGPLAGPVYAAAVMLDMDRPIQGLKDSKLLSASKRQSKAQEIKAQSKAWGIGIAIVKEIDELNILRATFLSMSRAVRACLKHASLLGQAHADDEPIFPKSSLNLLVQVDGNHSPGDFSGPWSWTYQTQAIIGGDKKVAEISAASILAKVERDAEMARLHAIYPEYGFSRHAGYGTAEHLRALALHGPCPEHRRSFGPVKKLI